MRAYILDRELTPAELAGVEELMECAIEQVRIPHVLPEGTVTFTEASFAADQEFAANALRRARIERDFGQRCLFVIPMDMRWYHAFLSAIYRITGFFPFAIQTADHRERLEVPGELRILDMQGLLS